MKSRNKIGFIEESLKRRTFALSILILLLIAGSIISWFNIPIEVMPRENVPPFLYLHVNPKSPSSPENMELALTLPVEGAIRTVSGVLKLTTSTSSSGVSASITFKPQTDLDMAAFTLQEALQELETQGILDMHGVSTSRLNPDVDATIQLAVTYDRDLADPLQTIGEDLRVSFEQIPEISKVEINGLDSKVIEFNIAAERIKEFGLQNGALSNLSGFRDLRSSIGESALGSYRYLTNISARLLMGSLKELEREPLGVAGILSLQQIAKSKIVEKNKEEISHKNGNTAIFIEIFSKDGANLFQLDDHLKWLLGSISTKNPEFGKLHFEFILDKVDELKGAIDGVFHSLYEAVFITFIIVFLFLRNWRQTIVICMAIPINLLLTIAVLYSKGVSLNVLTLSGLILGIGIVVDGAILVVSRIAERRSLGDNVVEASARGSSDVFNPLLMSTLTNVFIFLPVAFIEGGDSFTDILKAFQIPLLSSLGTSMMIVLFVLPILMIQWRSRSSESPSLQNKMPLDNRSVHIFKKIRRLKRPILAVTLGSLVGVIYLIKDIQQTDIESPREPNTGITVGFSPEIKSAQRKQIFEELEAFLLASQSAIGFKFMVSTFNPLYLNGNINLYPKPSQNIDQTLSEMDASAKASLARFRSIPGLTTSVGFAALNIGTVQRSDRFTLAGPKMVTVDQLLKDFGEKASAVSGVDRVRLRSEEHGEHSLIFLPNEALLSRYALTLDKISRQISSAMASVTIGNLSMDGHLVGAKISVLPSSGIWTLEALRQMKIQLGENREINFIDLGKLVPLNFTRSINRTDGVASEKSIVYFKENLNDSEYSQSKKQVREIFQNMQFPRGYGVPRDQRDARIEEMQKKSQFVIALSCFLIYLLLGGMFESILLPFAILFTVPLALLFGVAGLRLFGLDLDVMARLSLIILVGSCVNSAIILLDLIMQLREQGLRRIEAVIQGCSRRLKAVLMTMTIQIISVLPVALGRAKIMGIPYSSLGICIISGTLVSTLITLVILPMIYEFLDDLEKRLKTWSGLGAKTDQGSLRGNHSN